MRSIEGLSGKILKIIIRIDVENVTIKEYKGNQ
jgi:hypothetical protein